MTNPQEYTQLVPDRPERYSQQDEEVTIKNFFSKYPPTPARDRLTFIDIGAGHFTVFSNVAALIEQGWGGYLVEPSPFMFPAILKACEPYKDRVNCVNAAISGDGGLKTWWDCQGELVSTFNPEHKKLWEGRMPYREFLIPTVTPASLLEVVGKKFNFINIDVEGVNADILEGLVNAGVTFDLLCVEEDVATPGARDRKVNFMKSHGYELYHEYSANLFFYKP